MKSLPATSAAIVSGGCPQLAGATAPLLVSDPFVAALPSRSEDRLSSVGTSIVTLEPWTVYGDMRSGWPTEVDIPDIGVLPPPGRYIGTVVGPDVSAAVIILVKPRPAPNAHAYRRIEIQPPRRLIDATVPVALRFEAIDLRRQPDTKES